MHNEGKNMKRHLSKRVADGELDSIIEFEELQVELDDEDRLLTVQSNENVRIKSNTFIKKTEATKESTLHFINSPNNLDSQE